jgi:tetratricopeptide (TPR) repeat protein
VLALIARGEPFASDMPGREAEECFPPALRRALNDQGVPEGEPLEPIAADMRREGDGPHRAMLKLLAGMLGVAFDDLVRRDVQRRLRWLTALASASVVGVVVFAFLAVMAVQARNEAQHQRLQAEGLIEFMLGDLRKKLEPVGRLEVLDSVGEKALAYYGAQEAEKLDATALGHRSRAMHLIGEIRDLRGQPAEAQKAFEQAAATTAQLLAQAPNDGQRIFDHAQSVFWVGDAAWKRGDGPTAERWMQEYLALSNKLANLDPKNLDWLAEKAFAYVNLGVVQLKMGRATTALESLRVSERLLEELAVQRPALTGELAQNHGWRATAYEYLGDYENALQEQRRKLSLFRSLPDADKNRGVQRGIYNALEHISRYELMLGRIEDAASSTEAGLVLGDTLVNADPGNVYWLGSMCGTRIRMAEIQFARQDLRAARSGLATAKACVTQLDAKGALSLRDAILLKARLLSLVVLLGGDEASAQTLSRIEDVLNLYVPKVGEGVADRIELVSELANLMIAKGDLLAARDKEQATRAWGAARTFLEALPKELNVEANGALMTLRARAALRLNDIDTASNLVSQISKSKYRHPAFAETVRQVQAARGGGKVVH